MGLATAMETKQAERNPEVIDTFTSGVKSGVLIKGVGGQY